MKLTPIILDHCPWVAVSREVHESFTSGWRIHLYVSLSTMTAAVLRQERINKESRSYTEWRAVKFADLLEATEPIEVPE